MRHLFATFAFALLGACGGGTDTTTPTSTSIKGTWSLQTINGQALPYLAKASPSTELTAEQITFDDISFTLLQTFRITDNGSVSTQSSSGAGTYALTGASIVLTTTASADGGGRTDPGTVSGNTLTVQTGAVVRGGVDARTTHVFTKR